MRFTIFYHYLNESDEKSTPDKTVYTSSWLVIFLEGIFFVCSSADHLSGKNLAKVDENLGYENPRADPTRPQKITR